MKAVPFELNTIERSGFGYPAFFIGNRKEAIMDDELRKEALRRAAIKANHGKTVVIPSVAPIYP